MSIRVSFELEDSDLEHFRLIMRQARRSAARYTPEDIVAGAEKLLDTVAETGAPAFVQERLAKLRLMIEMLSDIDWRLPHQESKRVLNALAYFTEPEDLIPDSIPGLGFLDDAIMIELVVRELRHEIEAYEDFCTFRRNRQPSSGSVSREDWLEHRRKELQTRMRRRRKVVDKGKDPLRLFR